MGCHWACLQGGAVQVPRGQLHCHPPQDAWFHVDVRNADVQGFPFPEEVHSHPDGLPIPTMAFISEEFSQNKGDAPIGGLHAVSCCVTGGGRLASHGAMWTGRHFCHSDCRRRRAMTFGLRHQLWLAVRDFIPGTIGLGGFREHCCHGLTCLRTRHGFGFAIPPRTHATQTRDSIARAWARGVPQICDSVAHDWARGAADLGPPRTRVDWSDDLD